MKLAFLVHAWSTLFAKPLVKKSRSFWAQTNHVLVHGGSRFRQNRRLKNHGFVHGAHARLVHVSHRPYKGRGTWPLPLPPLRTVPCWRVPALWQAPPQTRCSDRCRDNQPTPVWAVTNQEKETTRDR